MSDFLPAPTGYPPTVYLPSRPSRAARRLARYPVVREVLLRPGKEENVNWERFSNREARLAQQIGQAVSSPCVQCINNKGPFTTCVIVPGEFKGSCANCLYNHEAARCSFRTLPAAAAAAAAIRNATAVVASSPTSLNHHSLQQVTSAAIAAASFPVSIPHLSSRQIAPAPHTTDQVAHGTSSSSSPLRRRHYRSRAQRAREFARIYRGLAAYYEGEAEELYEEERNESQVPENREL
ncbi:hypothetical protein B7494_g2760 [Chlorociboria aeruginascens]|nr:hypothetical protein B7494_g2760 [Chlorociboria aeruginascens]